MPELQSTGPLWTAFSHTHPHSVTGSLALSTTSAQAGNPSRGVPAVCGPALEIPGPTLAAVP